MSTWMNEAGVPTHNGNGFPHMNDPSAAGAMMDPSAFMANPGHFNAGQFPNPNQQQQQQMAAAMQNGPMRMASPPYQNQYPTNSVIPSKRPRPREDSLAGSPRQNPGMLPTSRSETPQQFPGYQPGGAMPQQTPGQPSPYPHLQPNGSSNATPSPIMGNQLRPGSVPQRVATASPHPFSPNAQQFGSQASPIPSEHGTPQPNPYMQNMQQNMPQNIPQNMPPGFNPNFTATPSAARPSPGGPNAMVAGAGMMPQQMGQMPNQMGQMPNQMFPPQMQQARNAMEQQKLTAYQARIQQLQGNMPNMPNMPMQNMQNMQQMAAQLQAQNMAQAQAQAQARGMMPKQAMPMANGQIPPNAMRPQQRPTTRDPEQFMKNLTSFMNAKNLQLEPNPSVADRPVHLMTLFQAVYNKGGYKNTTATNSWPWVSNAVGFHPGQVPQAPQLLKAVYERNLLKFEEAFMHNRQKTMHQNIQGPGMPSGPQGQATPTKQMPQPPMNHQNQMMQQPGQQGPIQAGAVQTPVKQMQQPHGQPAVNGFSTPQGPQIPQQSPNPVHGHSRNSLSRSVEPSPAHGGEFAMPSPAPAKPGSMTMPPGPPTDSGPLTSNSIDQRGPTFQPESDEYQPCSRELVAYGGIDLVSTNRLGADLEKWKPDIPPAGELGNIDLHALTRSLQCGIHGEVRLALDTLATVTGPHPMNQALHIQLKYSEDLVEALLDCAEEQLDLLAEHTTEESVEIDITPYEDIVRACRMEKMAIREIPVFGTPDYDLDRAVDRLICITTIFRNLSFPGEQNENHSVLADESIIKFLCAIARYLGTRNMLLRTHANTLDFMKDAIVLLSNIAGSIVLPGRDQALCLLHFILAFSPNPAPTLSNGKIFFASYEPPLHPYLPHAVDALAKLFARDEPNRTHYKNLLTVDGTSQARTDLLNRTFGLAIASIPDQSKESRPPGVPSVVESRKPFLMQGLLAADIIASIAPGYESGVTKAWLSSGNGFAQNLFRLIRALSIQFEAPHRLGGNRGGQQRKDGELVYIVCLGVSMLRKLAEKARDPSDPTSSIPPNVLPSMDSVFGALQMTSQEWTKDGMLQQLISYASLED
jgi:SWI/SNF chromatin-remodeling complex subunit SWI1